MMIRETNLLMSLQDYFCNTVFLFDLIDLKTEPGLGDADDLEAKVIFFQYLSLVN